MKQIVLLFCLLLTSSYFGFSQDLGSKVSVQMAEVKPKFKGGDLNSFSRWVNSRLDYPESAKQKGIRGRVKLQFTIKADGKLDEIQVLESVHESLANEAVRVVSKSPKWTPGYVNGQPVDVVYTFPVIFDFR